MNTTVKDLFKLLRLASDMRTAKLHEQVTKRVCTSCTHGLAVFSHKCRPLVPQCSEIVELTVTLFIHIIGYPAGVNSVPHSTSYEACRRNSSQFVERLGKLMWQPRKHSPTQGLTSTHRLIFVDAL